MPLPVLKEDIRLPIDPVVEGGRQGTAAEAELAPFGVRMDEEVVAARAAENILGRITRNGLCAAVPIGDPTLCIDEVNAVGQAVQNFLIKVLGGGAPSIVRCWMMVCSTMGAFLIRLAIGTAAMLLTTFPSGRVPVGRGCVRQA